MRRLSIIIVSVALLAGCGSAAVDVPTAASSAAPAAVSSAAAAAAAAPSSSSKFRRPSAASEAAYVAAFRQGWPALAQGRSDKGIGNDVDNFCGDLSRGEDAASAARLMGRRIATDTATPDAATVAAVVKLATAHCR
jgi:hypothetical protein